MNGEAIVHGVMTVLHLWSNGAVMLGLFLWRIGAFVLALAGFVAFAWQGRPPRWQEAEVDRRAEEAPSFSFR